MTLSAQEQIHTIYQGSKPKNKKEIREQFTQKKVGKRESQ